MDVARAEARRGAAACRPPPVVFFHFLFPVRFLLVSQPASQKVRMRVKGSAGKARASGRSSVRARHAVVHARAAYSGGSAPKMARQTQQQGITAVN